MIENCPNCKSENIEGKSSNQKICKDCDYIFYINNSEIVFDYNNYPLIRIDNPVKDYLDFLNSISNVFDRDFWNISEGDDPSK